MRIGNPDSKYTYSNGNQLDIDVATKNCEHRQFIDMVKNMVTSEPDKIELRYQDLIKALVELKNEYRIETRS